MIMPDLVKNVFLEYLGAQRFYLLFGRRGSKLNDIHICLQIDIHKRCHHQKLCPFPRFTNYQYSHVTSLDQHIHQSSTFVWLFCIVFKSFDIITLVGLMAMYCSPNRLCLDFFRSQVPMSRMHRLKRAFTRRVRVLDSLFGLAYSGHHAWDQTYSAAGWEFFELLADVLVFSSPALQSGDHWKTMYCT